MEPLGTHLLLELRGCDQALLNDLVFVKGAMRRAAKEAGATIVGESFHQFDPSGVTGILAIAESHLSIHTWPERGYAAADIFTCGTSFKPHRAADLLIDQLRCGEPSVTEIRRGLLSEPAPTTA